MGVCMNFAKEMNDLIQKPKTPTTQGGIKTLFARNLFYGIARSDIEKFFKEAGEVVDVRLGSYDDGRSKGWGHVEFASAEAAAKALELNGKPLLGRVVKLELAKERETPRSSNYQGSDSKGQKTVFVRGFNRFLGANEVWNDLKDHFSACGDITRISVPTDLETGASRRFAFIELKDGFNNALKLNGSKIRGLKITVSEARPRQDRL